MRRARQQRRQPSHPCQRNQAAGEHQTACSTEKPKAGEKTVIPSSLDLPHEGKQCAMLELKQKDTLQAPPALLERASVALVSPEVKVVPGTWVQSPAGSAFPRPFN